MSIHYTYNHQHPSFGKHSNSVPTAQLAATDNAGHADHWAILATDIADKLPSWLSQTLEHAAIPHALSSCKSDGDFLLIETPHTCHIKQIFELNEGRPHKIVNMFPAVNSPYGLPCSIQEVTVCQDSQDAVLRLNTADGTSIYAFDTLYAINNGCYQTNTLYYVNFSAWAYDFNKSREDETILVDDPKAIRYHRAFNDIVAKNNGDIPADIDEQIKAWQPDTTEPLAPVEINLGHSCIYLFGETFGQEDDAWVQGQVLGKSYSQFFDIDITLFDVVVLREHEAKPFVIRIATCTNATTEAIAVHDYIQANIWLQAAIYQNNQNQI